MCLATEPNAEPAELGLATAAADGCAAAGEPSAPLGNMLGEGRGAACLASGLGGANEPQGTAGFCAGLTAGKSVPDDDESAVLEAKPSTGPGATFATAEQRGERRHQRQLL